MVAPPIALQIDNFVKYRKRISTPSIGEVASVIGPIWGYGVTLRWIGLLSPEAEHDTFFEKAKECKENVLDYLSNRKVPFPATVDEMIAVLKNKYPLGNVAFALGDLFDERTPALPFSRRETLLESLTDYLKFREEINAPPTISEILTIFAPSYGVLDTLSLLSLSILFTDKPLDPEKTHKLFTRYLKKRKCPFHPTVNEIFDYLISKGCSTAEAVGAIREAYHNGLFFIYLQPTFEGGATNDEGASTLLC